MGRECGIQFPVVAVQEPCNPGKGETQCAKLGNLACPAHLVGAIDPPARRGTGWREQALVLVEPQGLGRDAQPPGGFGWIEEAH